MIPSMPHFEQGAQFTKNIIRASLMAAPFLMIIPLVALLVPGMSWLWALFGLAILAEAVVLIKIVRGQHEASKGYRDKLRTYPRATLEAWSVNANIPTVQRLQAQMALLELDQKKKTKDAGQAGVTGKKRQDKTIE